MIMIIGKKSTWDQWANCMSPHSIINLYVGFVGGDDLENKVPIDTL